MDYFRLSITRSEYCTDSDFVMVSSRLLKSESEYVKVSKLEILQSEILLLMYLLSKNDVQKENTFCQSIVDEIKYFIEF